MPVQSKKGHTEKMVIVANCLQCLHAVLQAAGKVGGDETREVLGEKRPLVPLLDESRPWRKSVGVCIGCYISG